MASNSEDDQWIKLKHIVKDWVDQHPNLSIDELLASWLDESGSLLRNYQVYLTCCFSYWSLFFYLQYLYFYKLANNILFLVWYAILQVIPWRILQLMPWQGLDRPQSLGFIWCEIYLFNMIFHILYNCLSTLFLNKSLNSIQVPDSSILASAPHSPKLLQDFPSISSPKILFSS